MNTVRKLEIKFLSSTENNFTPTRLLFQQTESRLVYRQMLNENIDVVLHFIIPDIDIDADIFIWFSSFFAVIILLITERIINISDRFESIFCLPVNFVVT